MSGDRERTALIAGAGIGGLAAALMLARDGWRVTLCDRETELREVGAGVQLSPNASRLLFAIGLKSALDGPATRPEFLRIKRARDAAVLNEARLGTMAEGRYGAPFLAIHRGDLHRLLLQAARRESQIEIKLGHTLCDMRMGEAEVTGVFEFAHEALEAGDQTFLESRVRADLLIGADGLWSRARSLAGLPSPSLESGKSAWRALVPRDAVPLFARDAATQLWMGPSAHLVHYPVCGGDMINIVAITEDGFEGEGWDGTGEPDLIRQRFAGWAEQVRDLIHAATQWKRWRLLDRAPESRWSRGQMTLLGDAAHPMLPFIAQGASQAIEDAAALSAELITAHAAPSIIAALKRYDHRRISRTARIQRLARQQGRIYHLAGPFAAARDLALRMMPADMLLKRYDWIYAHDAGALKG